MSKLKLIISLILLLYIGACQNQGSSNKQSVQINDFIVSVKVVKINEEVTFSWAVSEAENGPLSCKLDIDNDNSIDYLITDCKSITSKQHTYTTIGNYVARLTATNQANSSASATINITITDSSSITIAAVGDIACDPNSSAFNSGKGTDKYCHMQAVADQIAAVNPTAFLPLGDLQYEKGELGEFERSYDLIFGRFLNITYPTTGNHEYLTTDAVGYFDYFGDTAGDPNKGYYSYDLGSWHIVTLNSSCSKVGGCRETSPQAQWLKKDLAEHPTDCTLAYWHHPLFSSSERGNDDDYRDFWEILYEAGAEIILVAHNHHYERFAPLKSNGELDENRGIRQFVVGTGGKNLRGFAEIQNHSEVRNDESYGFLKLNLYQNFYNWEFISEEGIKLDSGSNRCHF